MNIFNMVKEAMTPVYDETFCQMVAMESDMDCLEQFREACGAPAYEASTNRVRIMGANEALTQLSRHAGIAASMDPPISKKPDYSAAFEAINATLDTSINPEMREEILAAQRQTALGFYDALESFMQGAEEPAMEGKLWDSFMNKGAGEAWKTANYEIDYQPRGNKSLGDFQLYVCTNDDEVNALHAKYPHIGFKRGRIVKGLAKVVSKISDPRYDLPVMLYWIDPVNPEDPKSAVCVATADLNPKYHVIHDISVRSEFQRYGLMNQIIQYVMKEYQCNEASTAKQYGEIVKRNLIAEAALIKAGFTKIGEDEYEVFWRKGNPLSPSFHMSRKDNPC